MSQIGRQCEDVPIDGVSIRRDRLFKRTDGKPMAKIVESGSRHAGTAP